MFLNALKRQILRKHPSMHLNTFLQVQKIRSAIFTSTSASIESYVKLGLVKNMKKKKNLDGFFRLSIVLPLIPLSEISNGFSWIIDNKPEKDNDKIEAYLDYILSTWVGDPDHDIIINLSMIYGTTIKVKFVQTITWKVFILN
jgi:hypothetical protein